MISVGLLIVRGLKLQMGEDEEYDRVIKIVKQVSVILSMT